MSNEEIYDNDVDMEVGDEEGASAGFLDNDFEVLQTINFEDIASMIAKKI